MQVGTKMRSQHKMYFSEHVINLIFTKVNLQYQKEVDALVIANAIIIDAPSTYGFVYDNVNFIHSTVSKDTLTQQQFLRTKLDIPHDSIIPKAFTLLKNRDSSAMDKMRFKSLINGMLSVVKTCDDFALVFKDMFIPEIELFNEKYSTKYGKGYVIDSSKVELSDSDLLFVKQTKERFEVMYNRYRVLTDLLGL